MNQAAKKKLFHPFLEYGDDGLSDIVTLVLYGAYDEALEHGYQLLEQQYELNDPLGEARVYHLLAYAALANGDGERMRDFFSQALFKATFSGVDEMYGSVLDDIRRYCPDVGNLSSSRTVKGYRPPQP